MRHSTGISVLTFVKMMVTIKSTSHRSYEDSKNCACIEHRAISPHITTNLISKKNDGIHYCYMTRIGPQSPGEKIRIHIMAPPCELVWVRPPRAIEDSIDLYSY